MLKFDTRWRSPLASGAIACALFGLVAALGAVQKAEPKKNHRVHVVQWANDAKLSRKLTDEEIKKIKAGRKKDDKRPIPAYKALTGVKAGTNVMLWQAYLVPQGDSVEDLAVQVKQGNTVRETKDVKVKGEGWRSRQWTGVRLNKPGSWTVSVMRGDQVLKEISVKVN